MELLLARNPWEFLIFLPLPNMTGNWGMLGGVLRWRESPRKGFCGGWAGIWAFLRPVEAPWAWLAVLFLHFNLDK